MGKTRHSAPIPAIPAKIPGRDSCLSGLNEEKKSSSGYLAQKLFYVNKKVIKSMFI